MLRQKRAMERQLQRTMDMTYNLATVSDAREELQLAEEIAPMKRAGDLRRAATQLTQVGMPGVEEALEVQDEYENALREVHEVGEILTREFVVGDEDCGDLEAELDAEMAREAEQGAQVKDNLGERKPDYSAQLDSLPMPPTEVPNAYVPPPPPGAVGGGRGMKRDAIIRRAQRRSGHQD